MNITTSLDNGDKLIVNKPGAELAVIRNTKGYSMEYIAEKLHLRVQLLELLEADEYTRLPEPVFIKGYLRAYARLMDVPPEPFIQAFLVLADDDPGIAKPIWKAAKLPKQKKTSRNWFFIPIAVLIVFALLFFLKKYAHGVNDLKPNQEQDPVSETAVNAKPAILPQSETMRSFFKSESQVSEVQSESRSN